MKTITPHLSHPKYRPDIDGLRAIAILSVLTYHAFPLWLPGGFIGVDIFFVISGFLISTIIFENLEQGRFNFKEFYFRRIRRIFPALILVLFTTYAIGWFALFADEYKQLGNHIAAGAGFISNFILWNEVGYFDNSAETKPLLHLWSLGIEEQFYLIWPLLAWIIWKSKFNLLPITLLIFTGSLLLNINLTTQDPTSAFYLPQSRFWELLGGSLLAWITIHKNSICSVIEIKIDKLLGLVIYKQPSAADGKTLADILSFTGIALLAYGFYEIHKDLNFPGKWAMIPVIGAVLLISSGTDAWVNRTLLSNRILVWFGLISFPLYLWHWPLLSLARIIESEIPSITIRLSIIAISIILAWLTYQWVEKPIRFGKNHKSTIIALILSMTIMGYIGYNTYSRNGLTFRMAEKINPLNNFASSYRESCEQFTKIPFEDDWCNKGTSLEHTINTVMIGDSFANAYTPMLTAYSKNTHYKLSYIQFARGQCPALLDYGPEYCREMTNKVFEYIKSSPNIKTVILANAWPDYYNGKVGFHSLVTYEESAQSFKSSFEKTLNAYRSIGKKLVIMLSPPLGSNPKSCITREIQISDKKTCSLSTEAARSNDGNYRDYMLPLLNSLAIQAFDPFKYFCNDTECKITDHEKIFSIDGKHLSVFGSEYLESKGKNDLDAIFK